MIRAGVIGVGAIGRHHVRIYNQLDDVQLVAIADPDEARRMGLARLYKTPAYASFEEMFDRETLDVVSIAVPTVLHREVTLAALERGVNVLVEKPIAATVEEAAEMIKRAAARGLTLMVGHVERFNPALIELKRRLAAGELGHVFQVYARRLSPFPAYIRDVGVVMDLATHELDIMRYLLGSEAERIYAETERNLHNLYEDMLAGTIKFENGIVGVLDINWLTPTKVRELRITGERGMFLVDYLKQDLYFYENSKAPNPWDAMALFRGVGEGNVLKFQLNKVEPLEAELAAFIKATVNHTEPAVTGLDGLHALALVQMVLASAEQGQVLRVRDHVAAHGWAEMMGAKT
ncbi:MAG: Gfo/Idh/MocA family oxidoreductase [Chloroflexi bacterium]|nr:Gfo/Idh/MocA family oxidoreductase [Chloroflexota bacterium]